SLWHLCCSEVSISPLFRWPNSVNHFNPVGGTMWVDIEAPEGVTEADYQFLPSKNDHFASGKITRTFSTNKPGTYTFTFNSLTYGGYEMKPVTVTINAVPADTEGAEEK
ncbi:hypothetical protein LMJ64_21155, partial [Escherichia coli]|nr:hypothetical protein [Escherichia coli]MCG4405376.1 hypothetical protein [Escherichia coli]